MRLVGYPSSVPEEVVYVEIFEQIQSIPSYFDEVDDARAMRAKSINTGKVLSVGFQL